MVTNGKRNDHVHRFFFQFISAMREFEISHYMKNITRVSKNINIWNLNYGDDDRLYRFKYDCN